MPSRALTVLALTATTTTAGCILQPETTACAGAARCDTCLDRGGCGWCDGRCVPGSSLGADRTTCESWHFASCSGAPAPEPPPGPCSADTCGGCLAGGGCTWCAMAPSGFEGENGYCTSSPSCSLGGQPFDTTCPSSFGCGHYDDCGDCAYDPECEYCWDYHISDTTTIEQCTDANACPGCADGTSRACGYCRVR